MSRKVRLGLTAAIVAAAAVTSGSVTANAGLLDGGHIDLPGGGGVDLPGHGGGGGVHLPGGGGVNLPGGGNGGGIDLPGGGGSIQLPGGGTPTLPGGGTTPPPTGGGGGGGSGGGGGDDPGRGGNGGRGGGHHHGGGSGQSDADQDADQGAGYAGDPVRSPDGTPTNANPSLTVADFGPAPVGVPNFVIDEFSIPPFLLPIYQACGTQYGVPWQVLASINRIETAFGTNLNVSTAGAQGWMQFIPSTWEMYGVDANNDGRKDPYNPVDAICGAARYLKAAGAQEDIRTAIFAYNHADWYVDEVLLYANQYGKLPADLIGSLTGLTEGARFPVAADSRYADDISEREAADRAKPGSEGAAAGNVADVVSSSPTRRGINIYSRDDAPVVAVNDGVVKEIGDSNELGRYVVLQDAYGNSFTYAQLGEVAKAYPVPKEKEDGKASHSEGEEQAKKSTGGAPAEPINTEDLRVRTPALPDREGALGTASPLDQMLSGRGYESFKAEFGELALDPDKSELRPLREGSKVVAGTVLGRIGDTGGLAPHVNFSIQPAGRGAPTIDPKPILDGWKLLEATHLYRAAGKDPFEDSAANAGQVLLLSKDQAVRALLSEPRVEIYPCGRQDISTGQIDVRIMRLLLYLAESGFRTTITSLKCGHSVMTTSGNISQHSTGSAVDIAMINGIPVLGNQGPGSISESLIKQILELQGAMVPDQVISLMDLGPPTLVLADHADHVHVGYAPGYGGTGATEPGPSPAILKPAQWERLIGRLSEIDNPKVSSEPSEAALPAGKKNGKQASEAHVGE